MVLGKNVTIFDWEWGRIRPLEMGRKGPDSSQCTKCKCMLVQDESCFMVCASVQAIIHSLKLVDYHPVQTHKPCNITYTKISAYSTETSICVNRKTIFIIYL